MIEKNKDYENLSNFVNNYNSDKKGFKRSFLRDHRTLQQSVIKLFFEVMEEFAETENRTDLRNEASYQICKKIINDYKTETGYSPSQLIPHI